MLKIKYLFKNHLKFVNNISRSIHTLNAFNLNNYRSLISVKGPDAAKFLQGLVTNDIYHLTAADHKIEYSMILNNKVIIKNNQIAL
jgi:folate-binding Fe-S cluster repair protein YgfZ